MKANVAPEKLYVDTDDRLSDSILYGFTEKRKDDDIEYVHKDFFMKKVIMYLIFSTRTVHYSFGDRRELLSTNLEEVIEDFKNYMKGE